MASTVLRARIANWPDEQVGRGEFRKPTRHISYISRPSVSWNESSDAITMSPSLSKAGLIRVRALSGAGSHWAVKSGRVFCARSIKLNVAVRGCAGRGPCKDTGFGQPVDLPEPCRTDKIEHSLQPPLFS